MKKFEYGFIIAAGKQSRFQLDIPKALVKQGDVCLLDINYKLLNEFCDQVFVICSTNNCDYFDSNKYKKIIIESGLGSGDAINKCLNNNKINDLTHCIIIWGDSIFNRKLIELSVEEYNSQVCMIPCVLEYDPYVELGYQYRHGIMHPYAKFKKYNDNVNKGFHDQCLFLCNVHDIKKYLNDFIDKFYLNDKYIYNHKHGNEFEFLDIFNDTDCPLTIYQVSQSLSSKSFNSIEELQNINFQDFYED